MKNVANLETDVSFALYYYSRMLKEWLKEALKVSKTSQAELSRQLTENWIAALTAQLLTRC